MQDTRFLATKIGYMERIIREATEIELRPRTWTWKVSP